MTEMDRVDPEWFGKTYGVLAELFPPQSPQHHYREAFAETGVIQPIEGMTIVGGRAAIDQVVSANPDFSCENIVWEGNERPLIPLSIDPPEHGGYRKLLDKLFRPAVVDTIEPDMVKITNDLIDAFVEKGRCRVEEDFAIPFPATIFLRLMGLPLEDTDRLVAMAAAILHPGDHATADPAEIAAIQHQGGQDIYAYFNEALDDRKANPRDDILSGFLNAEVDGRPITREEILDMVFNLIIAGLDTVTAALTCFFTFLAQNDEHRRQLVENPDLTPQAVEE